MIRRSRFASALVVGTVLTALVAGSAAAAPTPRVLHPMGIRHPSRMVAVQRGVVTGHSTWVGPGRTLRLAGAATAEIVIDYHGSAWTVASKAAFESAVAYWSQTLTSSVPIVVSATFKSLPGTTLGQAGPSEMRENFSVNAQADTLYPIALANAIAGFDLNGADPEIEAEFDNQEPWFFGTDNVVPPNRVSFRTVVLHELGHGLGFLGSMDISSGVGWWGDLEAPFHAWIFDRFAQRGNGTPMLSYKSGSTLLKSALTSNDVYFVGTATNPRARLYAPSTYSPGSTFSHLDEKTYKQGTIDSLMTPIVNYGEGIATAGPIVLEALQDMGWGPTPDLVCHAPGDIDGDGFNDVIGVSGVGNLTRASGIGNGRLSARVDLGPGYGGTSPMVIEDMTGDGCADLVAYTKADHQLWAIPNSDGRGTWGGTWKNLGDFTAFGDITGIAATGDITGDARNDLLVRTSLGVLWRVVDDGAGSVVITRVGTSAGWNAYTEFFSAGDVDGDGIGDLYVRAKANNGTLKLFSGDGTGGLKTARSLGTDWNYYSEMFASRDLSGDELPDVVGRNPSGNLELNRTMSNGGLQSTVTILSKGWGTFKLID